MIYVFIQKSWHVSCSILYLKENIMSIKCAIEKIKEIYEELEYEWFTYTHLRKFARLNAKRKKA